MKGKEKAFTAFGTDAKSNEARGDPFLESADQISYFVEPTAVDPHTGKLKQLTSTIESKDTDTMEDVEQNNDHNTATTTTTTTKLSALCKVGHGLHLPDDYHSRRKSSNAIASVKEKEEEKQHTIRMIRRMIQIALLYLLPGTRIHFGTTQPPRKYVT